MCLTRNLRTTCCWYSNTCVKNYSAIGQTLHINHTNDSWYMDRLLYHPSVIGTGKCKSHIHMGYTGLYRFEKNLKKLKIQDISEEKYSKLNLRWVIYNDSFINRLTRRRQGHLSTTFLSFLLGTDLFDRQFVKLSLQLQRLILETLSLS